MILNTQSYGMGWDGLGGYLTGAVSRAPGAGGDGAKNLQNSALKQNLIDSLSSSFVSVFSGPR